MQYKGFDVTGLSVLITGGTSGLGLAIAGGFAAAGAVVTSGSSSPDKVQAARGAMVAFGSDHTSVLLDVTDAASIKSAVAGVVTRSGKLDILVNAAGITHRAPAIDADVADWERVLRVNLTGTFLCSQAAAREMRTTGGGAIINIASLASSVALAWVSGYCASKAGVVSLTQALAVEWAEYNIRVNAIAPGVFPTPLNRALIDGTPRGAWFKKHTPMGRFGDPEELVGAAIYLASPAASYVTGETLAVDGGFLATGVPTNPP